jgi:hypothetical protein
VTEKKHENLSENSRSPGRDLSLGSPKYEEGVLTTRPRRSVTVHFMQISHKNELHYFERLPEQPYSFREILNLMKLQKEIRLIKLNYRTCYLGYVSRVAQSV